MFTRRHLPSLLAAVLLFGAGLSARAQSGAVRPKPTPTPSASESQDEERVFTEEVRLPVAATDEKGRFDPSLELDDVLIVEDDVPQQVKSVRRIPASVLLVLALGGELNPAMRAATTRDIGLNVLSNLRAGDTVAAIQYSGRAEVVQGWTVDHSVAARSLRTKLISGRGSDFSEALVLASGLLREQPLGNRHLVLVTDGVDSAGRGDAAEAVRKLIAAQASVHVISYTAVGQREMKEHDKYPPEVPGMAQSRADIATVGIDPTRPPGMRSGTGINPPSVNGGIRFDPALRRRRKAYERDMKRAEAALKKLTDETGGQIYLPPSTEEMVAQAGAVARDIGLQYVVTYRPKRPLALAPSTEYRRLHVGARRVGLTLRARRGYVVGTMRQTGSGK